MPIPLCHAGEKWLYGVVLYWLIQIAMLIYMACFMHLLFEIGMQLVAPLVGDFAGEGGVLVVLRAVSVRPDTRILPILLWLWYFAFPFSKELILRDGLSRLDSCLLVAICGCRSVNASRKASGADRRAIDRP